MTKQEVTDLFQANDIIEFLNMDGSKGIHMLNEREFRVVDVLGENKLRIDWDTSKYDFIYDGALISLKKRGEAKHYSPLKESIENQRVTILCGNLKDALIAKAIYSFRHKKGLISDTSTYEDSDQLFEYWMMGIPSEFVAAYKKLYQDEYRKYLNNEINISMFEKLVRSCNCEISTMTAIFGGLAAVEALKLTGKYTPIDQWYAYNMTQLLPDEISIGSEDDRYKDNIKCFGLDFQNKLNQMNIFLPGVGAIGWEVLKCVACLGISLKSKSSELSDGKITITDFDRLEISNLNRQFLFTDKDKRKFKVDVAKTKILSINPDLNISSHKEKLNIHKYSKSFNFNFWDSLDVVINGLDNLDGRIYLDKKCVEHEIPFLESGTQGEMAHTSVIVPFITNTYEDYLSPNQKKADDKESIPFCTLRNRPTSVHHCTEWAISKFNDHFNSALKDARLFLESELNSTNMSFAQIESIIKLLDWISSNEEEITFKSWLRYALTEFHQYFYKDIEKLRAGEEFKGEFPKPIKFDLSTDDKENEKSHFSYV